MAEFVHMHLRHVVAAKHEAANLLKLSTLIGSNSDATAPMIATAAGQLIGSLTMYR